MDEGSKEDKAPVDEAKVDYAPVVCWKPERVEVDLRLSQQLIRRMDWEKGIKCPLLPEMPPPPALTEQEKKGSAIKAKLKGEGLSGHRAAMFLESRMRGRSVGGVPACADGEEPTRSFVEEEVEAITVSPENLQESLGKLDQMLAYLWRVHGVDYYAGTAAQRACVLASSTTRRPNY